MNKREYALCVHSDHSTWKCSPIYIGLSYIVLLYTIMYSISNYFKLFCIWLKMLTCFVCLQGLIQPCRSNAVLSDVRRIMTSSLAAMSPYFDFQLMMNVVIYGSERYLGENLVVTKSTRICINHFEKRFISRVFHFVGQNGQRQACDEPRKNPILTEDAYPTIFEGLPS